VGTDDAIVLGAVAACAAISFGVWVVGVVRKQRAFERLYRSVEIDDRGKTPRVRRSALHRLIDLTRRKT
jgi:hypothetical protein